MQLDQSLLDEAMEKACTKPNPALTRRITRSVIMELKKASGRCSFIPGAFVTHLCGVDPTSERAIFNHYGRVAVEGRAMTSYDREVAWWPSTMWSPVNCSRSKFFSVCMGLAYR